MILLLTQDSLAQDINLISLLSALAFVYYMKGGIIKSIGVCNSKPSDSACHAGEI